MINLIPLMIERVGVILIVVFLLSQSKSFRRIIHKDQGAAEKLMLIALFGLFGVISNYTGIQIHANSAAENSWLIGIEPDSAIANTRIMGIAIGSLLGGPLVGLGIGLIAGVHRFFLGGFTAAACAISAILAGGAAGWFGMIRRKKTPITPTFAVGIGMLMEVTQMGIILLVTRPFELAWDLVKVIGIPMVAVNGLGMLLFMLIIQFIFREQERTKVLQTSKAFYIADRTLPFFRQGLNPESCREVADIMLQLTDADAIAITDSEGVLAHVGAASDHHVPTKGFSTELTKKVLREGRVLTARSREEILCRHEPCPLRAAVVLPLMVHNKTVGTLKLYFNNPGDLTEGEKELAEGLANLFSTQLELAEAEQQSKLLKNAEIKALQAQVHPHFLFNAINTISVLCRTNPEKARKLLLELSQFFRSNLQGARQILIPLDKEMEHVKAYLSLEQARFPDRYEVIFEMEPGLEKSFVPPFILQPLVENSIRHAFARSNSKGKVTVKVFSDESFVNITVSDNGKGIPPEKLDVLGKEAVESRLGTGTALVNIRERLTGIYNKEALFEIKSKEGKGTTISISIPLEKKGAYDYHDDSIYSG
ncbi:two-component system sensor histidine kinase LytS [Peribacillus deserti]|uniref:histidine kinase n=1 Tax=Peribacillus deserti TaxID=673318 RepID=A0ABS2QJZ8_9BACI|nr:sensor histidine kinase [Peribacillus deserti]MBM7693487.1 two-component system sensor histidine kinase LytS [Peribacillus deserti]